MQRLFREAGLGDGLKRDRGAPAPADRGMILLTSRAGRATLAKWDDWRVAMSSISSASLMDTTLAPERPRKMTGRS